MCEGQGQLIKVPLEGKLVFSPSPTDMVLVNGVELTPESSLQALRTALTFHFFEHFRFEIQVFYTSSQPSEAAGT